MGKRSGQISLRYALVKLLVVAIGAITFGAFAGIATVYAANPDYHANWYISPIWNVGNGSTYYWFCSGAACAYATSGSSTSVYYMDAEVRIWHQSTDYPIKQSASNFAYNTTGVYTPVASQLAWEWITSQHNFRGTSYGSLTTYYTSYEGIYSCYNRWAGKQYC